MLHFSFENRAALDETGNGFHGRVELPGADRWVDQPVPPVPGAIRFDHAESKIVVARTPAFAGWLGLRVRVIFRAADVSRRLNLVEGDGSFALFIEPGGVLCGTINDGSPNWWGIFSPLGRVERERWYFAELVFTSQTIALRLDPLKVGVPAFLGTRTSAGLPLRPVGPAGIQIGYWPGGDSRYTFNGLIGPVWIDRFDEREVTAEILNRLICGGSDGTSRLEYLSSAIEQELTAAERDAIRSLGKAVVEELNRLMAAIVGQASDPSALIAGLGPLSAALRRLVTAHELAGTDALADPALRALLTKIYATTCSANPGAASTFLAAALRLAGAEPLPTERWQEIFRRHPEICRGAFPPIDLTGLPRESGGGPAHWIDDVVDRLCRNRRPDGDGGAKHAPCREEAADCRASPAVHVHFHCGREEEPGS